jgi:hypothetical protein
MTKENIKETFDILSETCTRKIIRVDMAPSLFKLVNDNKKYFTKLRKVELKEVYLDEVSSDYFEIIEEAPIFDENYNVINRIKR